MIACHIALFTGIFSKVFGSKSTFRQPMPNKRCTKTGHRALVAIHACHGPGR